MLCNTTPRLCHEVRRKPRANGQGPVSGVLEVSPGVRPTAAFEHFAPGSSVEFVLDPLTQRFVVGRPNAIAGLKGSPREQLAQSIRAGNDVVGGMFSRGPRGQILSNEAGGTSGATGMHRLEGRLRTSCRSTAGTSPTNRGCRLEGSSYLGDARPPRLGCGVGPILLLSSHGAWLGLADDEWLVGEPGGVVSGTQGQDIIALLPALERDPDVFFVELREALGVSGRDVESHLARVPLEQLLITALRTSSSYWAELSAAWFGRQALTEEFRAALDDAADTRWSPQPVRQAARRRLRRGDSAA